MSTEAETQLVSVERVMQYAKIDTEAPASILQTLPPRTWPQDGAIEFKNLTLRYRYYSFPWASGVDLRSIGDG